jgi:hypothetical protein
MKDDSISYIQKEGDQAIDNSTALSRIPFLYYSADYHLLFYYQPSVL